MQPGVVLAGRFRLVSLLGQGGMGSVWRAEHLGLRAPVAIKLMDASIAENQEALSRFHREAQAAAALRSPHVVQILDYGVDSDSRAPFIAMELLEGEDLRQRLSRVGRLAPQAAATLVTHVARALARAHEAGIVHRDLKPENVYLVRNEDEEIAKVLDFGISKMSELSLSSGAATRTGSVMGTPYYMSPEQIVGSKQTDYRTDLWALAVIAFECLVGVRPFAEETVGGLAVQICTQDPPVPSLRGPVPPGFDAWFARALAREPAGRFQSARELAETLRGICGAREISGNIPVTVVGAPPVLTTPSTTPLSRTTHDPIDTALPMRHSSPALIVLGVAAVGLAACGALAFALWPRHGATPADTPSAPPSSAAVVPTPEPVVLTPTVDAPSAPSAPPRVARPAKVSAVAANASAAKPAGAEAKPANPAPESAPASPPRLNLPRPAARPAERAAPPPAAPPKKEVFY